MKDHDSIYIIGGGPSLKGFDFSLLKNKTTLCVNCSIFNVPDPDYFITVDYTFFNKIAKDQISFYENKAHKVFVVDKTHKEIEKQQEKIYYDNKCKLVYNLYDMDTIIESEKRDGFGYIFSDFRTGMNSGYCALQFALLLKYKKIYLLGFDLSCKDSNTHYHTRYKKQQNGFNKKLSIYLSYFEQGLKQIRQERPDISIISCSPFSALNKYIPQYNIEDVL